MKTPQDLKTMKVSEDVQRMLKLVIALSGEKFYYQVLERLLKAELERLAPGLAKRQRAAQLAAERALDPWEPQGQGK